MCLEVGVFELWKAAQSTGEILESGIPPYTAYRRPASSTRPMPGRPDNNLARRTRDCIPRPAVRRRGRGAGRASSAGSRPCVVVGAEPAVRRRGRRAGHASPGRPPRPTSPLRRRSPRRSRHSRRASACFRRSVPHRPSWTWLRAALHRLDDGAVARPAAGCAAAVDSLAPDVAAASEGCAAPLLGLPPSTCGGGGCGVLPPRRLRGQRLTGWPQWRGSCTRSWPWGSPTLDASKTRMI